MTKQSSVFIWLLLSTATAAPAGRYVPGTPGGPWTEEELVITKSKLWRMFDWTVHQVYDKIKLLHGPGWEKSNLETELFGTSRMGPSTVRLGFHGCVPEYDGTGGCDGQLYWDGIGRIFMDYLNTYALPLDVREVPNFNNGLGMPVKLLEEIYTNVSFPEDGPSLKVSLRDSGKSRADLWALAGMVAVEYGIFTNNEVCKNIEFQFPVPYPDGLESNSWWGKHCTQKLGMANCQIEIKPENRFIFRSGRKDGLPFELYKKTSGTTCPRDLDIVKEYYCEDAAEEKGVAAEFKESETPHCKVTGGGTLCHKDFKENYNYTGYWYFVTHPLTAPKGGVLTPCRADLQLDLTTETECKAAAKWLYLEYGGKEVNVSGCFVMQMDTGGFMDRLSTRVYFGEGPPCPEQMDPPSPWINMRTICRHEHEKAAGYMASTWGHEPDSQKGGDVTAKYMKDQFGLNTRETVTLMGAHTMGRFHSRSELIRYIWVRNGGQMWNNEYYRNLANVPAYRFSDPDCSLIGDAWGQLPQGKWVPGGSFVTHVSRGEQQNGGPVTWVLDRHLCTVDCVKNESLLFETGNFFDPCCANIPQGASCKPDNGRPKGSNALHSDDDLYNGCERWITEGGNHELALPAEIGMMYQFAIDENGFAERCEGFDGGDGPHGEKGCKLQDFKAAGETMQMHEYVEIFAQDQNLWANEYMAVWTKTMQNGYETSQLTNLPHVDLTSGLICPTAMLLDVKIRYAQCFFPKDLSDPFVLISDMDQRILEMNATSGGLVMGDVRPLDVLKDPLKVQKLPPTSVWRTLKTEHGDILVGGIYEYGVGRLVYNETTNEIRGKDDKLQRAFVGPQVFLADYQAPIKNMQRWLKPMYFTQEQLSPPFIIFSEKDLKLLQVNEVNGSLELRQKLEPEFLTDESKITELPPKALWYFAGDQLVNGLAHAPFGELTLKDNQFIGGQGYLTRNYPGVYPEVLYGSEPPDLGYAKPEYFDTSKLSGPFVLISEMDRKILEVSDVNASLETVALTDLSVLSDASKVSTLPKKAQWYQAADGQIVNGLVGSAGMKWKFTGTEINCPEKNWTLGRNWPGLYPQVIYAKNWSGQIWWRPEYFTDDQLSEPFVLYSEMDYHLLQMNEETGALETSPVFNSEVFTDKTKVASVSKAAQWYLVKTGDGNQLVNGLFHASFGKLTYNESTRKVGKIDKAGAEGYAKRYGAWDVICSNETYDEALWMWVRPSYVPAESLSSRFVLVSEMDNRLLQVNSTTGLIEMGAVRDIALYSDANYTNTLPIGAVWSTYDVGSHQYLYSWLMGFAYGNLTMPLGQDHVMHGSKGYLARNWAGSFPEVLYWKLGTFSKSMYAWYKPTFISEDKLSAPFVLISNMDNRLLEANNLTGELQVGEVRPLEVLKDPDHVKSLNKGTWWHLATTDTGTKLVNGLVRNAVGDLVYNSSTSFITKDDGDTKYIARSPAGQQPEVITWDSVGAVTVRAMQTWMRPLYFAADTLSEPSVLISEMDNKLLQVNEKTGELEPGEEWEPSCVQDLSKVQALPAKAMWHLVEGAEGHVLVNKVFHYVAQLDYNTSNFRIAGPLGYLTRNYAGEYPETYWDGALAEGWRVSYQRFFEPSTLPETSF